MENPETPRPPMGPMPKLQVEDSSLVQRTPLPESEAPGESSPFILSFDVTSPCNRMHSTNPQLQLDSGTAQATTPAARPVSRTGTLFQADSGTTTTKRNGRQPGSRNKKTLQREAAIAGAMQALQVGMPLSMGLIPLLGPHWVPLPLPSDDASLRSSPPAPTLQSPMVDMEHLIDSRMCIPNYIQYGDLEPYPVTDYGVEDIWAGREQMQDWAVKALLNEINLSIFALG
ncbi:hypothetical protein V8E54_006720 [Elaphomyces granulatus]